MTQKSWMICNVLLNRFHKGNVQVFGKFLPDEGEGILNTIELPKGTCKELLAPPEEAFYTFHYSYISYNIHDLTLIQIVP